MGQKLIPQKVVGQRDWIHQVVVGESKAKFMNIKNMVINGRRSIKKTSDEARDLETGPDEKFFYQAVRSTSQTSQATLQ